MKNRFEKQDIRNELNGDSRFFGLGIIKHRCIVFSFGLTRYIFWFSQPPEAISDDDLEFKGFGVTILKKEKRILIEYSLKRFKKFNELTSLYINLKKLINNDYYGFYRHKCRLFGIEISSREEEYDACARLSLLGYAFRFRIFNNLIAPYVDKYKILHPVIYGIYLQKDYINIYYGPQTHDSATSKSKGYFIPFMDYEVTINSYYKLIDHNNWELINPQSKNSTVSDFADDKFVYFIFKDFDGTNILSRSIGQHIRHERGTKNWKWIRIFFKPIDAYCIDMDYKFEVGPKKQDWKGGWVSQSFPVDKPKGYKPSIVCKLTKERCTQFTFITQSRGIELWNQKDLKPEDLEVLF